MYSVAASHDAELNSIGRIFKKTLKCISNVSLNDSQWIQTLLSIL